MVRVFTSLMLQFAGGLFIMCGLWWLAPWLALVFAGVTLVGMGVMVEWGHGTGTDAEKRGSAD